MTKNKQLFKKLALSLTAFALVGSSALLTTKATETQPGTTTPQPSEVVAEKQITIVDSDGTSETVVKLADAADGKIGFKGYAVGRTAWHIRTKRAVFLGYTTAPNYDGSDTTLPVYDENTSIEEVIEKHGNNAKLYVIAGGPDTLLGIINDFANGNIIINKNETAEDTLPGSEVISSTGFSDDTAATKKVVAKYDDSKESYNVSLSTNFNFTNNLIPLGIASNPSPVAGVAGILKNGPIASATAAQLGQQSTTEYTHVDLIVKLDKRLTLADVLKNISFTSATFNARAILDVDYNVVTTLANVPSNTQQTTTFDIPVNAKIRETNTFIVRTTLKDLRNGGTTLSLPSQDIVNDMVLTSGDSSNLTVSKVVAKQLAESGEFLVNTGEISGTVNADIPDMGNPIFNFLFGAPRAISERLDTISARNSVQIGFEKRYKATYVFESANPNKSLPTQVTDLLPVDNNEYQTGNVVNATPTTFENVKVTDGTWVFKGWKENSITVQNGDIQFVGVWEFVADKEKPQPNPEPKPEPEKPTDPIKPVDPNKPQPKPQPKPDNNGKLLPETGEAAPVIVIISGVALIIAGIAILKRNKK